HRTTLGIDANASRDNYQVSYHGQATAHMDTFCHQYADGQMYNGYSVSENIKEKDGCKKGDIMAWRDGVVTRAVLYDIPQLKGVQWLEPRTPVTRADLEAWEKKAGVRGGSGDVLMLYVGRWKRRAAQGPWTGTVAGFFADTIPFIKQRDIAFVGHDFNIDWAPRPGWGQAEGVPAMPIHQAMLNWLGVGIVENLDLEKLVETARRLNRYEFMLTFAPLPVEGGPGSPINPVAVFLLHSWCPASAGLRHCAKVSLKADSTPCDVWKGAVVGKRFLIAFGLVAAAGGIAIAQRTAPQTFPPGF